MEANQPQTKVPGSVKPINKSLPIAVLVVFFILISSSLSFMAGSALDTLLKPPKVTPTPTTPITGTPTPTPGGPDKTTEFLPGKQYIDDTIMAITADEPKRILIATAARQEGDKNTVQNSRVSYFDGSTWTRKTESGYNQTTAINTNNLIKEWKIDIDPTRVLKETVTGKFSMGDKELAFDSGVLTNNIGMRSLPGYTKFMSTGVGRLTINGKMSFANILYTRIYSGNAKDIQFYDTPIGLTTHWIAFWDNKGNFYHIDTTAVDKPTNIYQAHSIGVKVDSFGRVSKTFDIKISNSNENPPKTYSVTLGEPISQTLNLNIAKSLDKSPAPGYNWFMSNGIGTVDGVNGFGLVEYIHD